MYISDQAIENFIKEDVPYLDLTMHLLNIGSQIGIIQYYTREEAMLCGVEEAIRIMEKLHLQVTHHSSSGTVVQPNEIFLEAKGSASSLHMAWKVCQNILDNYSGIATRTYRLVQKAKQINSDICITTTRKGIPGTKEMSIKAVVLGGALPHRLGVSETILAFEQHMAFTNGFKEFLKMIPQLKKLACEKKLFVEATSSEQALLPCKAQVDGIQFDKLAPADLEKAVSTIRKYSPNITLLAAGGIHIDNISEYAKTGVDAIVTTSLYFGKPIDIGVKITPISK